MPKPRTKTKKFSYLYRKSGYVYFRNPIDKKLTPLPAETSPDFARAHAKCLYTVAAKRGEPAPEPAPVDTSQHVADYAPGSVGRALLVYFQSTKFTQRTKDTTKINYKRNAEVLRQRLGHVLLKDIDIDRVDIYAEEIDKEHGPSVADAHVNLLSLIWKACRKHAEFGIKQLANPTDGAEEHYSVKNPHRPWTDAEQTLFMQTAPDNLKLAKTLQHFLGQRGGDGIKIKWDDFDGRGIKVTPEKTDRVPDPLPNYHLCTKPLLAALKAAPRVAETILVSSKGTPWNSASALSRAIRDHLEKLGLWKAGQRNPVLHGLRKNMASELAETGATSAQIKSAGGWKSSDMADYYAQHASQVAMNQAAVERWDDAMAKKKKLRVVR